MKQLENKKTASIIFAFIIAAALTLTLTACVGGQEEQSTAKGGAESSPEQIETNDQSGIDLPFLQPKE